MEKENDMEKEKVLVSYSAGTDSTTLAFYYKNLGYDVTLVTLDDGAYNDPDLGEPYYNPNKEIDKTPYNEELHFYADYYAKNYGFKHIKLRYPHVGALTALPGVLRKSNNESTVAAETTGGCTFFVGYKFLMLASMLSFGAAHGYKILATGHQPFNDHYEDELPENIQKLRNLWVSIYGSRVNIPVIEHPFYKPKYDTKAKVIKLAYKLGVPLDWTYSCQAGKGRLEDGRYSHCGVCVNCQERVKAFKELGIKDPAPYLSNVVWEDL